MSHLNFSNTPNSRSITKIHNSVDGVIFIIGPTAAGKSKLGKILSVRENVPYIDIDEVIEKETGLSIAKIIHKRGVAYFRKLESLTLRLLQGKAIVATGAGIIESNVNYWIMRSKGTIIYLPALVSQQFRRLNSQQLMKRPLLKGAVRQTLIKMAIKRSKKYRRWSNETVNWKI